MLLKNITYAKKIQLLFVPIFLLMTVGLLLVYEFAADSLRQEHAERLQWTAGLTDSGLTATQQELVKLANLFQTNRNLKEYLYISTVLGGSSGPLSDLLRPLQRSLDIDDLDLFDMRGRLVVDLEKKPGREDPRTTLEEMIGRNPLQVVSGFMRRGGLIKMVAITPLRDSGRSVGYIAVGRYLDSDYLRHLKETSGNDILLVANGEVVQSTLPAAGRYAWSEGKLSVSGVTYSVRGHKISGLDGEQLGQTVVALSDDDLIAAVAKLKYLMLAMLAASAALSYGMAVLFIRTLVKPLGKIIAFTDKVNRGDLDGDLEMNGKDEIAELAGHLDRMRKQLAAEKDVVRRYTTDLEQMIEMRTAELNQVQRQLFHSQKMEAIGQLAGGIAHDFNNILTAIIGYAVILHRKLENEPLAGHADQIVSAAKRAAHLTQSLLAFSRKQVMKPEAVDLNDIVLHMDKLLSRLIGEHYELMTALADASLTIMADRGQVEQVLMNLVANARDAMPGGGRITVRTAVVQASTECIIENAPVRDQDYALLVVEDAGSGMDEATRSKIFEPFFTTKESGKGTGLGLAVVYGIVQQHNGCITVESEVGRGAALSVYFPLIRSEAAPRQGAPARREPRGGTETVLVGEDDPVVRELIRTELTGSGYTVLAAADGEDAVTQFMQNSGRIQLLLLDVMMPKRNGKEAYEAIRKVSPGVKVLFMSGYTSDIIGGNGPGAERAEVFNKPFSTFSLLEKVREVLDRRNGTTAA